jgi:hypothetical protein
MTRCQAPTPPKKARAGLARRLAVLHKIVTGARRHCWTIWSQPAAAGGSSVLYEDSWGSLPAPWLDHRRSRGSKLCQCRPTTTASSSVTSQRARARSAAPPMPKISATAWSAVHRCQPQKPQSRSRWSQPTLRWLPQGQRQTTGCSSPLAHRRRWARPRSRAWCRPLGAMRAELSCPPPLVMASRCRLAMRRLHRSRHFHPLAHAEDRVAVRRP